MVPRAVACTVEVVSAVDGAALADVLVEAIVGEAPPPLGWVRPDTDAELRATPLAKPGPLLIGSSRTDERGRATLMLRESCPVHLRLSGAAARSKVVFAKLTAADTFRVEVERGAVLTGSVGPLPALRALDPERKAQASIYAYHSHTAPSLRIVWPRGEMELPVEVRIDTMGRFRAEGLPPGPVEVHLRYLQDVGENPRRRVEETIVLGTCVLKVDAPRHVDLQLPGAEKAR